MIIIYVLVRTFDTTIFIDWKEFGVQNQCEGQYFPDGGFVLLIKNYFNLELAVLKQPHKNLKDQWSYQSTAFAEIKRFKFYKGVRVGYKYGSSWKKCCLLG